MEFKETRLIELKEKFDSIINTEEKENRPLADFLPTLTIAAKNLATEMTNYNVTEKDMYGEESITDFIKSVENNINLC